MVAHPLMAAKQIFRTADAIPVKLFQEAGSRGQGHRQETLFQQVSEAPTLPPEQGWQTRFDVADLYRGPVADDGTGATGAVALDEKLRQAYFWIVNHGIISPFYDIEYNDGPGGRGQNHPRMQRICATRVHPASGRIVYAQFSARPRRSGQAATNQTRIADLVRIGPGVRCAFG